MPYVERRDGRIVALYGNAQPYATEWLGEDDIEVIEYNNPPPSLFPLTARQFRLGLTSNGIATATIDSAIAAISDPQERSFAEIEWEYATQFERTHPLIDRIGDALGLTSVQIDTMWGQAQSL